MNVPCPKCKQAFQVPEEVMTRGVAHVSCDHCSFKFVIRLGDPGAAKKKEEPPPGAPLDLEGVKTSGAASFAAGEIGGAAQPKFVSAETSTSIRMDPGFEREIQQAQTGSLPPGITEQPTEVDQAPLASAPTAVDQGVSPADLPTAQVRPLPAPRPAAPPSPEPPAPAAPAGPVDAAPAPAPAPAAPAGPVDTAAQTAPAPTAPAQTTPTAPAEAAPGLATATPGPALQPQPLPQAPVPAGPVGGFESFKPVNAVPAPPPGAEVPLPPPLAAGTPVISTHQIMHPAYQHPLVMVITPQNPEEWAAMQVPEPSSGGMRALGLFFTILLVVATVLFFYVLAKNDWSLDLADLGGMIDRAFGGGAAAMEVKDELRGLEVDQPDSPIVEEAKLANDQRVLTIQGVVRNNDTRTRRFVYVRAQLMDIHGRKVIGVESPAGNVFTTEQLAALTPTRLNASINPAGRDGSNARLEPGQSVAYMVVITTIPFDYDPAKYKVHVEVSQAELFYGP